MTDNTVDKYKITFPPDFVPSTLPDGSVVAIKFQTTQSDKDLLTLSKGYSAGSYSLLVNLPSERRVAAVIVITRSSANFFSLAYSDLKRSEICKCQYYSGVSDKLRELVPRVR